MATGFYSRPTASFGYWRGVGSDGPLAGGQGSGMGLKSQGTGMFAQGQGTGATAGNGWHPTVIYLVGLIVAEMIVFGFIARALR